MLGFFDTIIEMFQMLFALILNTISGVIQMVNVLLQSIVFVNVLRAFVPSFLGASISIVILIGAVKLILGWGNS